MQPPQSASPEFLDDTWEQILLQLRDRLPSQQAFDTWFRPLRVQRADAGGLEIEVPNLFFVDWMQEHYLSLLAETAERVLGVSPTIRFRICPELESLGESAAALVGAPAPADPASGPAAASRTPWAASRPLDPRSGPRQRIVLAPRDLKLNPFYTFANFVAGSSSQLTYAACRAVAEKPGKAYNPLFIYGGVGLGKTHLMTAIGHSILESRAEARVLFLSAERFMNDMIASIQAARQIEFRDKYRTADVLLIDDIQFLSGKDGTQEEFFYTFSALSEAGRQIVVTSDKPPKDIPDLEERLVSRFNQGLVTDIKPPDLETRVAILQRRASAYGCLLPTDVALYIAERVRGNVRNLEGALVRLTAITSLAGTEITLALAEEILGDFASPEPPTLTPERIARVTAEHYRVPMEMLRGKRRTNNVAVPRQVAMYLLRCHTGLSFAEIGAWFRRDHTTVLYACEKMGNLEREDATVREALRLIRDQLAIGGA
jgi:chromosomal replication initiator protein